MPQGSGIFNTSRMSGVMVGPLVAGLTADACGVSGAIAAFVAIAAAVTFLTLAVREPRLRKFSDGLIVAIFFVSRYDTRSEITTDRPKYSATSLGGRANGIVIIVGVLSRPAGVT
jgi:hypothetical protein